MHNFANLIKGFQIFSYHISLKMNVPEYLEKMKNIQNYLLSFVENESNNEENYQNFINSFSNLNIPKDYYEIKSIINLIQKIANNHHRSQSFFTKIEQVLIHIHQRNFFKEIKVFNICKNNKRLLLFLIQNGIIIIDDYIVNIIKKTKYKEFDYKFYFLPEIIQFLSQDEMNDILQNAEISQFVTNDMKLKSDFYNKRSIGENDDCLCKLIRNDSVTNFETYIKIFNIKLHSKINHSIFETNSFLLHQEEEDESVTFIEYAAFFGAIQIVKYLIANNVNSNRLLLFAIHSNNYELIQMLETDSTDYKEIFDMAIQCHHNEVANYIKTNHLENDGEIDDDSFKNCLKNYNFSFIQPKKIDIKYLEALCLYDYSYVLDIILKTNNIDVNDMIVLKFYNFSILF